MSKIDTFVNITREIKKLLINKNDFIGIEIRIQ